MKYMIASDIHGSAFYCKKLIEAFENENPDKLILLGDILYHGPRNALPEEYNPMEVAMMLNKIKAKILCVRGNCDSEVDQMVLEFPIMADYCVLTSGEKNIYATHGHIYNEKNPLPMQNGDILLHGHTHVSCVVKHEAYTYMNPGSVSIPKENTPHGYMIIENGDFLWKELDGTVYREEK